MQTNSSTSPWYTERSMWLVVGLPAAAVLAGFFTLWLAITRPDPEVPRTEPTAHTQSNSVTPPTR